ncbi:hypothetical protein Taro_053673 [Colocasia esculenta]|uniref:glucomannan 4-beta-mannosyltransferase n=1 Tax=Colocasia esculenta TaxID=4460 RepID=A0A843XLV9_COLES|nr:hypothetical protein [Colocasia esculenta]
MELSVTQGSPSIPFPFSRSSSAVAAGDDASSSLVIGFFSGDAAETTLQWAGQAFWASADGVDRIVELLLLAWRGVRVTLVVPLLKLGIFISLAMTLMILVEKLAMGAVCLAVKVLRLKPERRYRWEPITADPETGNSAYPMVLVQIPMYNEREVYKLSIGAACGLEWPTDRMIIQVLDDSTDPVIKDLVEKECMKWKSKGMNIHYEVRDNRKGYKAGALKEGMKHAYVQECDYIAMFDADFQPESDFLTRTIPFLVYNPDIALVQSRWKFVNADECMLTRIQEMSLDYHFKIEQEAGSSTFAFFGFNGTAGVWRISAIEASGGWQDRTTVEDMDLAVRAGLGGWKFVYVGDIKVKSELPSTFKAYRFQQHRWSCGPANLFKKMALEIILNKAGFSKVSLFSTLSKKSVSKLKVSSWKKFYVIYSFFFVGKIVAHSVTFVFYCVVIPASVLVPEVDIPLWGVVYVPTIITLCKSVGTPSSFHLLVFWILFENVMSLHRIKAAMTGLLESGRVNEWIVTEKLGDGKKAKPSTTVEGDVETQGDEQEMEEVTEATDRPHRRFWHRFHFSELAVGLFLTVSGCYDVIYEKKGYFVYLFLQAIAFFVAGFDYVGTRMPIS